MTKDLYNLLQERGFIYQCTDEANLSKKLKDNKITAYVGFDCTADSLHVGSLLQIMMLKHFIEAGHTIVVLLGGGTTKIGDPSGKDEARQFITDEAINKNKTGIETVLKNILLKNSKDNKNLIFVDNADWLDGLKYIEFLRDYGRHFSINRMLGFESVKRRLDREQNLSFLEFNYSILQAYDFIELYKKHNCTLQFGGSDQWGNIVSGIDLAKKVGIKHELFGLTSPLMTTANGAKMGKSAGGAIWLTESKLSSFDYWQFWRNVDDADVGRFLRIFTNLPIEEIKELETKKDNQINEVKIILANEATKIAHGEDAAKAAAESAKKLFTQGSFDDNAPTFNLEYNILNDNLNAYKLVALTGLAKSGGEAKRLIASGAVKINDEKIIDHEMQITTDLFTNNELKLAVGKKKFVKVVLV